MHQLLGDPTAMMVDGARRLGSVFRLQALWRPFVVIAGDAARTFMAEGLDGTHLTRHPIFDPLEREFGGGDFVMAHTGPRHTRLRGPLAITFSRQVASPFIPHLVTSVRAVVEAWPRDGRVVVSEQTERLAFAQWCTLLGPGAGALRLADCSRLSTHWMLVGSTMAPAWTFCAPWYRAAHRRVFSTFRSLIRDARQAGPATGGAPSIVDTLLAVRDAAGTPLTDDEVLTYLAYGTLGACAYVSRLTAFMLYEIARDPALVAEIRAESRAALADGVLDAADLRRMRVLQSVYQETLRRHPVSPGMPFVVKDDFEFQGRCLRKGHTAILSPVPMAFDAANFPSPERFEPARCREPRNEHRGGTCHPFGLGNRTCVAGGLVEVMALTMVATLLDTRAFTVDPAGYQLGLRVLPLPAPDPGFRLRIGGEAVRVMTQRAAPGEDERLATFGGHDDPAVVAALARARSERFAPGAVIVREGDPSNAYYLLQAGSAIVSQGSSPAPIATLEAGQGFGELGLLQSAPRSATVSAGPTGAEALVLDRDAFLAMVSGSDLVATEIRSLMQKRLASNRLRTVASRLTADAVARVLPDFEWQRCAAGEIVIHEGDAAGHFYVVVEGEVRVSRRSADGSSQVLATLGPGEYFGEAGLLHNKPRNATVTASAGAVLLRTDAAGFERLLNRTGEAGTELSKTMLGCAERLGVEPPRA